MQKGLRAYAKTQASALSGRALEGEALLQAARKLDRALADPTDAVALSEALRFNLNLWTVVQAELSGPQTPLDPELRRDLLNLSLYMDKATARLSVGFDGETLQVMIAIDRDIAQGLLGQGG